MSAGRSSALQTLAVVLFAFAVFDLIFGAARTAAFIDMIESDDFNDPQAMIRILQVGALVALGMITWLAASVARRGAADRALWWAAALVAGLAFADVAIGFVSELAGDDPAYFRLYRRRWFRLLIQVIHLSAFGVIAVAAARASRRTGLAAAVLLVLGTSFGLRLMDQPLGELSTSNSMWLRFALTTALPAVAIAATGWLCRRAAKADPHAAAHGDGLTSSPEWLGVADGLHLYRSALIWRLLATFGGYVLLLMAVFGRSPGLARFLMWSLPLATTATALVMFAGVVKFAKQPPASPGRGAAVFCAVVMAMALLLDFVVLTQVLAVVGADTGDYGQSRRIREAIESAQKIAPWAMALSFAALIGLLVSMRALANRLAESELAGRAAMMVVWVVLIGGGVVALRAWFLDLGRGSAGLGLMFAFGLGIGALILLIAYLGLIRDVEARLRGGPAGVEVPRATVVDE